MAGKWRAWCGENRKGSNQFHISLIKKVENNLKRRSRGRRNKFAGIIAQFIVVCMRTEPGFAFVCFLFLFPPNFTIFGLSSCSQKINKMNCDVKN